jgi:hypothetical protein
MPSLFTNYYDTFAAPLKNVFVDSLGFSAALSYTFVDAVNYADVL